MCLSSGFVYAALKYLSVALRIFVTSGTSTRNRQTRVDLIASKIEIYCQNSAHYITVVIRLHFLMQNNHNVSSIELVCLYLASSPNSTHYITVVIRFHFLMQNNHDVSSIDLLCLYLANSYNSTHYITVVIRLHFLMQNNHDVP